MREHRTGPGQPGGPHDRPGQPGDVGGPDRDLRPVRTAAGATASGSRPGAGSGTRRPTSSAAPSCGSRPTAMTRRRRARPASSPTSPSGRVPVGWVAVEPRTEYPRLLGLPTVWKGRPGEDKRRRRGLVGDLLRRPQGLPQARHQLRPGRRHGRLRAGRTAPAPWRATPCAPSRARRSPGASCTSAPSRCSPTRASPRSAARASAASSCASTSRLRVTHHSFGCRRSWS